MKNRGSRSFSRHGEIALQLLRTYLSPVTHVHCTTGRERLKNIGLTFTTLQAKEVYTILEPLGNSYT